MMVTRNYQQIWGYATAPVACHGCGRVNKRRVREYCTVNPFNKNDAGEVLSPSEVLLQATALAEKVAARQVLEGRVCRKCEQGPMT